MDELRVAVETGATEWWEGPLWVEEEVEATPLSTAEVSGVVEAELEADDEAELEVEMASKGMNIHG